MALHSWRPTTREVVIRQDEASNQYILGVKPDVRAAAIYNPRGDRDFAPTASDFPARATRLTNRLD